MSTSPIYPPPNELFLLRILIFSTISFSKDGALHGVFAKNVNDLPHFSGNPYGSPVKFVHYSSSWCY